MAIFHTAETKTNISYLKWANTKINSAHTNPTVMQTQAPSTFQFPAVWFVEKSLSADKK